MAQRVKGDLYYDLDGQLSEIKRQIRQPSGYPYDPSKLHKYLQDGIEGRFDRFTRVAKSDPRYTKHKSDWELIAHVSRRITSVSDVEPISFLRKGEDVVRGYDLIGRALYEFDAAFGQEDAEWLLEHQKDIPAELRNCYIFFPGTIRRPPDGILRFPCLYWDGREWCLDWDWLEYDCDGDDRLLRFRKPA